MTRKLLLCAILVIVGLSLVAMGAESNRTFPIVKRASSAAIHHAPARALDETIYYEDWESGTLDGWTGIDETALPAYWHIDTFNAYGGTGTSWWMGDTTNHLNGYRDAWYQTLDSPSITLPATAPFLRFWHRYSCETPTGTFPTGYNGWDGMNLRISTNGGTTWSVVPSAALTPAYDRTSLYSFGSRHGEGTNIPGWCGAHTTWSQETANLTTWAGQTVMLRWAFASDESGSTPDVPSMFGWEIDAIRVYQNAGTDTVFSDDANSAVGWTPLNHLPTGGNLWRIATDNTSPAGPHILVCNNATGGQYNPSMLTECESPYIDLRTLANGTLIPDVQLTGSVVCTQATFPNCDYWGMEVSSDSGFSWCAVSNPGYPDCGALPNYVYIDFPATWASFNESYQPPMDFSVYLGHVVKFRFTFKSNADAQVDVGPKFDGFSMEYAGGLPNDVTCYTLQVRYPNKETYPFRIKAYYRNVGQNSEDGIGAFYRIVGQTWRPFPPLNPPTFTLAAGERTTRDTVITISTSDTYTIQARSQLASDNNLANDTSTADNIGVIPADAAGFELGYDNRTTQFRFNYQTHNGPMMHFTPLADHMVNGIVAYDLDDVYALFDPTQTADAQMRVHIYKGGDTAPSTDEIYNQVVTVTTADLAPNWYTLDLTGVAATRAMTEDFWVWFEITDASTTDRFPQIIGDDKQLWDDVHNYVYDGTTTSESNFFYIFHTNINNPVISAADEHTSVLPNEWSLQQNYPNPFNPSTEIRFNVPRAEQMTLKVFNVMGQQVATLVDGIAQPGTHVVTFDGSRLASGVYVCRLESKSFTATQKMLLMK